MSYLPLAKKKLSGIILSVFCAFAATTSCTDQSQEGSEENALDVPSIETGLLEEIEANGIGERFVISDFKPSGYIENAQRFTLSQPEGSPFHKTTFEFEGDQSLMGAYAPMIQRFDGKVDMGRGYIFINNGDKYHRLTFVLLEDGLVYLRGRGKVVLPSGKTKKFK